LRKINLHLSRILFLLINLLSLVSCGNRKKDNIFFEKFPLQSEVTGIAVPITGVFVNPLKMALQDSLLFIYDPGTKNGLIHFLIIKDKKVRYQYSLIPYGDGPSELYNVTSMFFSKDYFYLHDVQLQRLVRYKIRDLVSNEHVEPQSFKTNIGSNIITRVIHADSDRNFVGELMPANPKRFAFFDITDFKRVIYFGDYPDWGNLQSKSDDFSYIVKVPGNLFQSKIGFIGSDSSIVAVHPYIPVIELIQIRSDSITSQVEIVGPTTKYPPDFTVTRDGWAIPCNECVYNYESVRVMEKSFYTLYSGKIYKRDSYTASFIFRFGTDGIPIEKFTLDREITDFVIDEGTGVLYSISPFSDDQPLAYFELHSKRL